MWLEIRKDAIIAREKLKKRTLERLGDSSDPIEMERTQSLLNRIEEEEQMDNRIAAFDLCSESDIPIIIIPDAPIEALYIAWDQKGSYYYSSRPFWGGAVWTQFESSSVKVRPSSEWKMPEGCIYGTSLRRVYRIESVVS